MVKKEEALALGGQKCMMCNKNTLSLTESSQDIPFFGKVFIFAMGCTSCKYHKADVESAEQKPPSRYTLEVGKDELEVRVVKSSEASVKIPHIGSIESGPGSEGFVTNVEGLINRIKEQIEIIKDTEEDEDAKKKAKNLLKKIQRVFWGDEKLKLIIEDPSGNSAIISEKAVKTKL